MKVFTLAAGMAVGYVLGTRAGREKYEQIVEGYQKLSGHPKVVETQEKAKELLNTKASSAISKLDPTAPDTLDDSSPEPASSVTPRRPARRKPAPAPTTTTAPELIITDPLA